MSKTLDILDMKGASVGEFLIEDKYIELEKGAQAVKDCVVAYLAGLRAGTACTKTKAEVRGGGAKPFKQKGTGRARSGSSRNPIWRGGGIIFGPKPRGYAKKVNKKVNKLALKRSFSEAVDYVTVVDSIVMPDHKTKNAQALLDNLKITSKKALLIVDAIDENVVKATANIANLTVMKASSVNVYQLVNFKQIIVEKVALENFLNRIA